MVVLILLLILSTGLFPSLLFAGNVSSVVLFCCPGQNTDELSCRQNEVVEIMEDLGDGWLRVRRGDDEGYVPGSYVQIN